ncbi:hypothetical protein GCM10022243_09630 [Saccharothrix violaceirubra]|uniref:Uncharacterized protein n=1 Tax=Saccharothrix violaceirubra TaxID=413306 RepID=A0A7W7WWB0_9PSEU|nr:hypothetical protein [Saccharothrix violaceirubra]MBB4966199.1 hypothetical protein [Saccharothrix violaceirubra]
MNPDQNAVASGSGIVVQAGRDVYLGGGPERKAGPPGVALADALVSGAEAYEVHPALTVGSTPTEELTAYVRRTFDDRLAGIAASARDGACRMAVLVGGSSSGKTRACWESLHSFGAGWRLWHPLDGEQLVEGLKAGIAPRTVVWLNELQRFLVREEEPRWRAAAIALRGLVAAPVEGVLILATIWDEHDRWQALTGPPPPGGPDHYAQARELLRRADVIPVAATLDAGERARAEEAAQSDARWAVALVEDRPIPFLAGARYLVDRYTTGSPAARAVLEAAADARRMGMPTVLSLAFLEQAARDYLDDADHDRLPPGVGWVRHVIETDVRVGGFGVPGPLRPSGSGYRLADYLENHLGRRRVAVQPRDSLWSATVDVVPDTAVLSTLAEAAMRRGRFGPATRLSARALDLGDLGSARMLVTLLENAGEHAEALSIAERAGLDRAVERLRRKIDDGDTGFDLSLWWVEAEEGTRENGEELVWDDTLDAFSARLDDAGDDLAAAERIAVEAAAAGYLWPFFHLAVGREEVGDVLGAERLWRQSIAAGNVFRVLNLAELRGDAERTWRFAITADGLPADGL